MLTMKFISNLSAIYVAIYFVPWPFISSETPTKNYSSYRKSPWCTPSDYMRYPTTSQDVVAIVREAIGRGIKVKPIGQRHSQTDIICTEGIPIDMRKLTSSQMNSDNVTATFGSGLTIREACEFLKKNGRALRTTPAYGNITLGGAIGTGAHGSTIKYNSTISAQVVKMTVVNGLGELIVISDPEDLKSFRINLGLLGILVDVTLLTVPLYKVRAHNYIVSDNIFKNGVALDMARNADQLSFHWFPAFKEVAVIDLSFVDVNTTGNAWTNELVPSTYDSFNFAATIAKEIAFGLTSSECAAASAVGYNMLHVFEYLQESSLWMQTIESLPIYTEDGWTLQNPAVGYPHLMYSPICSETSTGIRGIGCFWAHGNVNGNITIVDNEIAIASSDLPAFVTAVQDMITKTPVAFPLQGIIMRFSNPSDAYMSMAYERETVHIEFALWKREDPYNDPSGSLAGYQTILQTLAKKFKGRSHWGKTGSVYHNSEMLELKLDVQARAKFTAAMNKFDPNGVFINNFGRRIKNESSVADTDPMISRCALLDNCFCSKNSDCGPTQICTSIAGYNYPVCKTRNETPEKSFDKSVIPPPLGVLNWLLFVVPNLANAVLAQCTLTSLLQTLLG